MKIRCNVGFILFVAVIFIQNELSYTLIFLSAACVHEVGHLLTLKLLGTKKPELSLGLCGAVINADLTRLSYRAEALVYISGAAANVIACLISLLVLRVNFCEEMVFFFFASLFYAALNLLPIRNFDGGRVMECVLLTFLFPDTVDRVLNAVFFISSLTLAILSLEVMRVVGCNVTLLLIVLWALFQCIPSKPCCLSAS